MFERGMLLVVSGPAGSGKGTVTKMLAKNGNYAISVSATTRKPRPGERHGVEYYFITREEFEARIKNGEMLEYTEYCGNYYGTPLKEVKEILNAGKNVILEIDVAGGMNVRKVFPETVLIMLLPPSYKIQEQRLRGRGTETEDSIQKRLSRAKEELEVLPSYDYVVINPDGGEEKCMRDIDGIVQAEGHAVKRNPNIAKEFFEES